ncbi:septal ring lytic transglycosylase RlpA family protein [Sulfuriferula thiophila]|uniref:septal ring lytic transglycosylase RlpA family protein n=1 Tax=Sulfuriferula thiophila TaxID=1781211 RepID=UPI000F609DDB|nr:septal ring lytic transglycosylase RlpA family protein [Sulfuriferula thiophila]
MIRLLSLIIIASLAGCASTPPARQPAPGKLEPAPATIAGNHKPGGYYLDDGPGDNPPANIDAIPDAVPKIETLHKYANRPYVALGQEYSPSTTATSYQEQGLASWYGRRFNGKRTASGETYDMYGMTAAHRTLPIPSYARVKSLASGKSVIVRINDRGPFHSKRIIDLSYTAAHKLGISQGGSGMVEVTAITPAEISQGKDLNAKSTGIFLQLGSFGSRENAEKLLAQATTKLNKASAALVIMNKADRYRVALGPYNDDDSAKSAAHEIETRMNLKPIRVVLE